MAKVDPTDETANVGVRWPARCIERVDTIAERTGTSRSDVLRRAVREWLDRYDRQVPPDSVSLQNLLDEFGCTPRQP